MTEAAHGFDPEAFDKTVAILDEICECKEAKKHRAVVEVLLSTYFTSNKSVQKSRSDTRNEAK